MRGNWGVLLLAISLWLTIGEATVAVAQTTGTNDEASIRLRLDSYFEDPADAGVYRAFAGLRDPVPGSRFEWLETFDAPADAGYLARRLNIGLRYDAGDCWLEHALPTLKARISAFGSDAPYVGQWVKVEQVVLASCHRDGQHGVATADLPPPMQTKDAGLARLQREDRAYQEAALLFYKGSFEASVVAFDKLAVSKSQDAPFARYMAIAIRAGSQPDRNSYQPLEPVSASLGKAERLLNDPTARTVQPYVYDLIGWIGANDQQMEARRAQVSLVLASLKAPADEVLADRETRRRYEAARFDEKKLFSHFDDQAALFDGHIPEDHTGSRAMAEAAQYDPLAAWLVVPVSPFEHRDWALVGSLEGQARLQAEIAKRSPPKFDPASPWSHLALMWNTSQYDPELWSVIDAEVEQARAAAGDRALAAAALDFFHQVRGAVMYAPAGSGSAAALDQAILRLKAFPFKTSAPYENAVQESLRYLMLSGRSQDARKLRDALNLAQTAQGVLAEKVDDAYRQRPLVDLLRLLAEDEDHLVAVLGDKGDALLNRLSIDELANLARRTDTPAAAQAMFARAAWARTYALGRQVPPALDSLMRERNPEATSHWLSRPGRPIGPDDRAALVDVLATPSLTTVIDDINRSGGQIDPPVIGIDRNKRNDDNWWGPWRVKDNDEALSAYLSEAFDSNDRGRDWDPLSSPAMRQVLDASFVMRHASPAEAEALTHIKAAPQLLTEGVISWVNGTGLFQSREGQPDALAGAVRTTRWGVDWAGHHGVYSKAAFDLLHQRFPLSAAARRTRYWYDCNGFCQDRSEDLPLAPPVTLAPSPQGLVALIDRLMHPEIRTSAPPIDRRSKQPV